MALSSFSILDLSLVWWTLEGGPMFHDLERKNVNECMVKNNAWCICNVSLLFSKKSIDGRHFFLCNGHGLFLSNLLSGVVLQSFDCLVFWKQKWPVVRFKMTFSWFFVSTLNSDFGYIFWWSVMRWHFYEFQKQDAQALSRKVVSFLSIYFINMHNN